MCRERAGILDALVADLATNHSIAVRAAILNYKSPGECVTPGQPPCAAGDERLAEANWQGRMASAAPGLTIWQDTEDANVWDDGFGAAHDDLMIYDREGRLFTWLGSESTLGDEEVLDQDLTKPAGYAAVRATIILAARASPQRCSHEAGSATPAWVAFSALLLVLLGCFFPTWAKRWRTNKGTSQLFAESRSSSPSV